MRPSPLGVRARLLLPVATIPQSCQFRVAMAQYRSGVYYTNNEQKSAAERSREIYSDLLVDKGYGAVTTEVLPLSKFYFAEDYHQQYLAKNPGGYCGIGGTGIKFVSVEEIT